MTACPARFLNDVYCVFSLVSNRPKSLLVFINPYGGKRRARQVFNDKVAAIFDLAGITSHVISKLLQNIVGLMMLILLEMLFKCKHWCIWNGILVKLHRDNQLFSKKNKSNK